MSQNVIPAADGLLGGAGGSPTLLNPNIVTAQSAAASLQRVTVTQPAAGADWAYTVPAGTWVRLLYGFCTLTSSSTVANRFAGLSVTDAGAVAVAQVKPFNNGLVASVAAKISYYRDGDFNTSGKVDGVSTFQVRMTGLILPAGYTLGSATTALQAADQYSAVQLMLEQWTALPIYEGLGPSQA